MEKKSDNKLCDICGESATNICFKCTMYFCDSCYNTVHNKKKVIEHKKEKLDFFVPMELKCLEHPNDRINLFCLDENGNYIYINIFYFI